MTVWMRGIFLTMNVRKRKRVHWKIEKVINSVKQRTINRMKRGITYT
jgi:hypothetical protein